MLLQVTHLNEASKHVLILSQFPVRFIQDVFLENYDPTIEGGQDSRFLEYSVYLILF